MENSIQLANRIREVFLNGTWVANTNYKDQLSGVSWQQATIKIGTLNTIAALTYHVSYYLQGVLDVFEQGSLEIRDKFSFYCPEITSDIEWENLNSLLWSNSKKLANEIEKYPNNKLDDIFVDDKYGTYRRNIEGLIEHSYYHLGQIVLINKIIQSEQILS
jgi:hypothetical protein